jgi:hypothetical protein
LEQPAEDGAQVKAADEAVLELGKVAMALLGEGKRMVGAADGGLQVTEQGIDRPELGQLDAQPTADDAGAGRAPVLRTDEAVRPARHLQRSRTMRLGSVTLQQLRHRQSRVKQHSDHLYGASLGLVRPSPSLRVSLGAPAQIHR